MVTRPEVLVIIPARGGSKGIPRKNIRDFAGYPLIAYSIAAGLQAVSVTRTIVSTDDAEIAAAARQWGAETPFMRPADISQDQTQDLPVYEHALHWLAEHEAYHPDVVVQLRPTSPVRPAGCVDAAVKLLLEHPEASSVRGVIPAGQNPFKMWTIDAETGQMKGLLPVPGMAEPYNAPRQALPLVYWQTGHIDAIRPKVILEQHSMSGTAILPLMIDPQYTVDIDNPSDWARSEWLVYHAGLDLIDPGRRRRPLPQEIELIVFDFDGVLTDNRVWVNEDGHEMIAANRSDSLGIRHVVNAGVKVMVLSTEVNSVVMARCRKMKIPAIQGVDDKALALRAYLHEHQIDPSRVVFVGNDINDTPCFPLVGCAVAVADAQPEARRQADLVLERDGGHGAARELCDLVLQRLRKQSD